MLGSTYPSSSLARRLVRLALAGVLGLLPVACQDAAAPTPARLPPTAAPIAFVTIAELLESSPAAAQDEVTTVGYLVADHAGAILVDGLSFTADGTPQLIDGDANQIWLGMGIGTTLKDQPRPDRGLQFATVRARGRLEGPGNYGPGGYRYQIVSPSVELLTARETTIAALLNDSTASEGRLVRLVGGLITSGSSALLVERIGAGGLPAPKARQIKLRAPLQDRALLRRLKGVTGGAIRFGQVQIEAFWRGGMLIRLSIQLVTE